MPVVIEPDAADGETGALRGTVRAISAVPFSGGPAAFESAAPVSLHRVDIALEENLWIWVPLRAGNAGSSSSSAGSLRSRCFE